jgi:hypothetical protein
MIAAFFLSMGAGALLIGLTAFFRGWGARRVNGWLAIANGSNAAASALTGDRLTACVASGVCAFAAWMWWKSGGGDGTKRRLKSWARKFRGVRRTAPAAGAA